MIKENHHPLFVFKYERVDDFHVGFLDPELHQVGQILEALGYHHQRPGGGRRGRVRDEIEGARVENGGTEETKKNESGNGPGFDQPLVGPFCHDIALKTRANVPVYKNFSLAQASISTYPK